MQIPKLTSNLNLFYISSLFTSLVFTIPVWVAYYHQYLTFTQLSLITGGRFLISLILELPTGAFADLFGRKLSIFIGSCISGLAFTLLAFSHNGISILIGLSLLGIGDSFSSGAINALVFDFLKAEGKEKEYPKVLTNANIIFQFGIIISSLLAGYLYEYWQGLPFLLTGIVVVISGICILFIKEMFIRQSNKVSLVDYIDKTKMGIKTVFHKGYTKNLSIYFIIIGGFCLSWQMYFNQIYATGIGYNEIEKGWLFAIIRFINVFIILKLLRIDRLLKKQTMFLFFPVLMILTTIPAIIISKPFGTMLLFTMTISNTLREIVLGAYVNEGFQSHVRATALSTLNMFVKLIYLFTVTISGVIIDRFGIGYVYFLMGIVSIVFILPKAKILTKQSIVTA